MTKVPYINTNDGVSLVIKNKPFTVSSNDKTYAEVVDMLQAGVSEELIYDVLTRVQRKLKEVLGLTPEMFYSGGAITFQGEVLHNYAADVLIGLIEAGQDYQPLVRFLEKLQANPSKTVVDRLYSFLEKGAMPITADGDFLAYKSVRADFHDIHSGKFDNSVGQKPSMRRNQVDENQNRTCSTGLHVCSYTYLPSFSSVGGHVMIAKVSPTNVVAIPADYNDAKMRVSEYEVIGEVEGYYTKAEDVLGNMGRAGEVQQGDFQVSWTSEWNGDDDSRHYTAAVAKSAARALYESLVNDGEDGVVVTVTQVSTGAEIFRIDSEGAWTRA